MSWLIPVIFDGLIRVSKLENERRTKSHTHSFLEFVYVCSGEAEYSIGAHSGKISAGDYFLIDYGTEHDYFSKDANLTIINCLFLPELIDDTFAGVRSFYDLAERYFLRITGKKIKGPTSDKVFQDNGTIGELFFKMLCEYESKKDGYLHVLRFLLCEIIIETIRKIGSETELSELTKYIISEINKNFNYDISLSKICAQKHYSLSYASSRFRSDSGMSFTDYLQNRRIEEGCRLLRETDMAISEIAESVGYGSIKFFNKVFKNVTKTTPREFRKQHKTSVLQKPKV